MALNDATLKTDIQDILDGTIALPTVTAAGDAWGSALHNYSKAGVIENPAMTLIPAVYANEAATLSALQGALKTTFSVLPGDPSNVASGITTALTAYWTTVTFSLVVGASLAGPALTLALGGIFSVVGGTHDGKAKSIRDAIAAFTKTVQVVYLGPAPPAGTFSVE